MVTLALRRGIVALSSVLLVSFVHVPQSGVAFSIVPQNPPSKTSSSSLSSSSSDNVVQGTKWSSVESLKVKTLVDTEVSLGDLAENNGEGTLVLSCLSHFGDFNAWEVTQQYVAVINAERIPLNSPIILVGIGSAESARQFARDLELHQYSDRLTLVADETGSVTESLGCYHGWLTMNKNHRNRYPQTDINPYLKLFGMIFGFGSPATISKVLYGYAGDVNDKNGTFGRKWVVDALLQGSKRGRIPRLTEKAFSEVPVDSSLRPFELATLRLQTGLHIVANWGRLGPKDGDLFTRMGGTFVFANKECVWSFLDKGILVYASIDEICQICQVVASIVEDIGNVPTQSDKTRGNLQDEYSLNISLEAFKAAKKRAGATARTNDNTGMNLEAEAAAKAKAAKEARRQAEELGKAKAEEEAKQKIEEEAKIKAEEEAKEKEEEVSRLRVKEEATPKNAEDARLKAEEEAKAKIEDVARHQPDENIDSSVDEETKRRAYIFQRQLLEAQLKASKKSKSNPAQTEEIPHSIQYDTGVDIALETAAKKKSYSFQRRLLEAELDMGSRTDPLWETNDST